IIQRRFYTYDANCLLAKEIVDDGVGDHVDDLLEVTERMETCIIPRKHPPYGPIKERATFAHHLKTKERVLINKEVFFHTKEGWIRSLHTFNSKECPIQIRRWQYDVMGRKISETDPDGNTTYWKWNRVGLCQEENVGKRITSYSYDPRHTLKSIHTIFADAKTETTFYKRDLMGRVIEITDPLQEKTLLSYSPLGQEETISNVYQTKKMVWDDKGYLQELILPTGATVYQRNVRGQPTEISYPDGSKETLSYTLLGKVATHTTRYGAIVNYTYNNLGQCLKEITVSPEGDALKKIFRRYNSFHLLEECQGEQHVTYRYDEAGRLIEKRCGEQQEKYFYTPEGHLQKIRSLFDRIFSYDKSGRILSETTLSPSGELYKKRNYGYDTKGNCLFVDEANSQTLFKYNSKNEKILEIDPEKKMTRFKTEIVGHRHRQQITDPIQRLIETFTDGLGRPTMIAKYDPHSTPLFIQEITYEEGGKPDTITYKNDTSSYTIQYQYEPMGELSEKREGEKITTFRYNEHGLKSELIKPDGVSFHYSFDSLGRMIRQTSSDGTIDLSYTYDSLDHLVEATDHIHNITCKRKYDAQGNLIREELGNGLCLTFNYDPLSRLKEMILPDQSHALYVWEGPRLKKVVWKEHTHLFLRYDQRGNLLEEALIGLAGKRQADYDVMGRLRCTEHKYFRAMIPPDGVDKAGRITKWLTNGGIQTFAYDSLDQLTQEEGAFHHHYTYDSFFNRLSIDQIPLSYANVFEMIKQGKTDCKYDANGNMIEKNGNTLTFDALDRLIRVETPKGTVTYTYDPFNRRLTRQVTSRQGQEFPKECFFWFQEMEIGSYMDQKCRSLRLLTPDKTRTLMMEIDGQAFAPLHDLRGHLIELIDPKTGELADETLYSAFGEQTKSFLSPWRFNEKRFDPETGFYYFGERYYDPELGRFITKDPLRESCGPNPYCFVKNNPIHFNDPIGLHHSSNPLKSTCEWIGNRIEWIGENLIPIPGVRDLISCTGRLVSGKGLNGFVPSWQREGATEWYIGDEELSATTRIHTANGINVSFQDMVNRCQRWSERLNGARIHFTYIADKGIITNALEWFVHRLGIHTASTKTLQNHLETLVSEVGTTGTIFNLVHSHAAECTSLIASHFRNRENDHIHSYTFGSPAMVSPTAYQKVVNFTSQRDPVTYLSPSRILSLFTRRQEIIPLPPQGIPLLDHCLEGPTYLPALYATFADYLKASGAGR
ncbi:MAG: hypothetical protein KDK65_03470, partial [Chlamydiia bacterium]|nr:hypothetical protein [Chlamydiia bacterium]